MTPLQERLRTLKASKGLSYKELADVLNLSTDVIKNYLTGRTEMPITLASKMCDVLDVNLTWLILGEGHMSKYTIEELTKTTEKENTSLASLRGTFDMMTNLWLDVSHLQTKVDDLQKDLAQIKQQIASEKV